jgi:NAD(P)H-dependent FMN reductase
MVLKPDPVRVAVIIGSTRNGRLGDRVAQWFASVGRLRPDLDVDLLDLAEVELPSAWTSDRPPSLQQYVDRLERADGFVVVTPEYNHSYPAALKQAIDLANTPWHAKPVGFVSYGGMSGGLRAVEHLRAVFAELHATTIRDVVSLHNPWALLDGDDEPLRNDRSLAAAEVLLDRLTWWAQALRTARHADPYAA